MLCVVAAEKFRRVNNTQQPSMDESGYFYDSPPIYHYGNNPLYFARFNYQSSSGELPSYSEASNKYAPQFASAVRSDSRDLEQFASSVRSDSPGLEQFAPRGGGGTLGIPGWGCAAGFLEPLSYTRASSA